MLYLANFLSSQQRTDNEHQADMKDILILGLKKVLITGSIQKGKIFPNLKFLCEINTSVFEHPELLFLKSLKHQIM